MSLENQNSKNSSFEEQFPSLKDDTIVPFRNGRKFVDIETIQENCLDKQKVRKAIDRLKFRVGECQDDCIGFIPSEELLKELNL